MSSISRGDIIFSSPLALQPRCGKAPILRNSFWRDVQRNRDFIEAQSCKITQLHDLARTWMTLGHSAESFIDGYHNFSVFFTDHGLLVERQMQMSARTFGAFPSSRIVH